jgi:hypothetical protein
MTIGIPEPTRGQLIELWERHIHVEGTGEEAQVRFEPAPDTSGPGGLSPADAALLNNAATQKGSFGHLIAAGILQVIAARNLAVSIDEALKEAAP